MQTTLAAPDTTQRQYYFQLKRNNSDRKMVVVNSLVASPAAQNYPTPFMSGEARVELVLTKGFPPSPCADLEFSISGTNSDVFITGTNVEHCITCADLEFTSTKCSLMDVYKHQLFVPGTSTWAQADLKMFINTSCSAEEAQHNHMFPENVPGHRHHHPMLVCSRTHHPLVGRHSCTTVSPSTTWYTEYMAAVAHACQGRM